MESRVLKVDLKEIYFLFSEAAESTMILSEKQLKSVSLTVPQWNERSLWIVPWLTIFLPSDELHPLRNLDDVC